VYGEGIEKKGPPSLGRVVVGEERIGFAVWWKGET